MKYNVFFHRNKINDIRLWLQEAKFDCTTRKKTYSLQTCAMQKHWVLTYFLKRETRELEVIERRPFCRDEYGPQKGRLYIQQGDSSWVLLGTGVLGDSLGALGHRMLCQFTRQQEPHSCLDLPTRDGRALVVVSQPRRLCCDALEDVVHEAVHDRHGLAGHSGVGMYLFEHLVDVDAEALLPLAPLLLLVGGTHIFLCLARLLHCFSARLGGHPRATCLREKIDVVTRKKMAKQQLGQPEIFVFFALFIGFHSILKNVLRLASILERGKQCAVIGVRPK